jgi:hypothetical protein
MSVPNWIDKEHEKDKWNKPWTVDLSSDKDKDFKAKCWEHGYLSPHFKRAEAASKGGDACGCAAASIPEGAQRARAQYHAFCLERVRHKVGDKPMSPLSWYRSPCHNSCVGGASQSQHLNCWATDWSDATRASVGATKFDDAMHEVFSNGGRGVLGNTRHIRHVDNGPARTWSY